MFQSAYETASPRFNCKQCGAPVDLRDYRRRQIMLQKMYDRQTCYDCTYWNEKIESPEPNRQIIDGEYILFEPWVKLKEIDILLGREPKSYYAQCNDGTVIRSNNIVRLGMVPEKFRKFLPDTARFITKNAYYRIDAHPYFVCKSKGCWDRYHCFWYDMSLEKDGPWNVIPEDHVMGGECCESFLDKDNTYIK